MKTIKNKKSRARERDEKIAAPEFQRLVWDAVESLPAKFKCKLENIGVVVRGEPTAEQKKRVGRGEDLLGLYEGVPLGERSHFDGRIFPDKITIFRGPITRSCRNRREIRTAVRDTVLHELAHYFGISDEHMLEEGTC